MSPNAEAARHVVRERFTSLNAALGDLASSAVGIRPYEQFRSDGLWEARNAILELGPILRRTIAGRDAADLGLMMVMAALRRSESRGGHYRADYPDLDPTQEHRTLIDPGAVETVVVG